MAEEVEKQKITRKRWTGKEDQQAIRHHKVPGRTDQAVACRLCKLGIFGTNKRKWTEDEDRLISLGGFPKNRTKYAIYQRRHQLGVKIPCNKFIDPKNPDQTVLDLKPAPVRKNPPRHHYESVNALLRPIYAMHNDGMDAVSIAKIIHQTTEFVEAAIKMKHEFRNARKLAKIESVETAETK